MESIKGFYYHLYESAYLLINSYKQDRYMQDRTYLKSRADEKGRMDVRRIR